MIQDLNRTISCPNCFTDVPLYEGNTDYDTKGYLCTTCKCGNCNLLMDVISCKHTGKIKEILEFGIEV